ncbi:hypothetical protein I317_04064 [Kwoniella heveanensis CBS 569]|nr:hypothetical protein I317_04064 [Kwoniella heveanensis CBS 569]
MDISAALSALEALSSSTSTSSSGPLNALIDHQFTQSKQRILAGDDPKTVIVDLQKAVKTCKKDVEKGLKSWYGALGNVGKAVDKAFPPNLGAISKAYEDPPLFSAPDAADALDQVVLDSLGRRGLWDAVAAMEEETTLTYPKDRRALAEELQHIINSILSSNLEPALAWCETNKPFLNSPPHPSSLPYHLHKAVFTSLASDDRAAAIAYARANMMGFVPTQPVLKLITSCLYTGNDIPQNNGKDVDMDEEADGCNQRKAEEEDKKRERQEQLEKLAKMLKDEFCRRYQWPKEDPLEVALDLGSRGGALNVIEKARKVMSEHLGPIRTWTDLPIEVPLPPSRRYHSVFVCPVSKEQATESNPPKMLTCGHVIAQESFNRLLKGGRRSAKCPYCPIETSQSVAQRLYF